jgi:hypothetical protein
MLIKELPVPKWIRILAVVDSYMNNFGLLMSAMIKILRKAAHVEIGLRGTAAWLYNIANRPHKYK